MYVKTDVLLLADVFKNFCNNCVASYGLDPAYYYILTCEARLKHIGVKFELLTDIDMVRFIECRIRSEPVFKHIRAGQQQIYVVVRYIETVIIPNVRVL